MAGLETAHRVRLGPGLRSLRDQVGRPAGRGLVLRRAVDRQTPEVGEPLAQRVVPCQASGRQDAVEARRVLLQALDVDGDEKSDALRDGYDTACVVSHIYCTPSYGLTQGFVHVDDALALPDVDPDLAITSEGISERGIRFLRNKAGAPDGSPWFLWLHYFDPHGEYVEQPGYTELFGVQEGSETGGAPDAKTRELQLYDGEIAFTDHHIGRVFDALEANGQAEDTIVVLVADHGEEFFDHGGHDHGHALYGELIRVPMLLRAPGIAPRRVPDMVRTVDLAPTVLDLVGIGPDPGAVGHSLRAAMKGTAFDVRPALSEIRLNPLHRFESVLDERYKLIRRVGGDRPRLFDLVQDPLEMVDLALEQPEVVQRLTVELEALVGEAERLGERFERAPTRDLAPQQIGALEDLGYIGGDEEEAGTGTGGAAEETPIGPEGGE